jgi:hypothetical protein
MTLQNISKLLDNGGLKDNIFESPIEDIKPSKTTISTTVDYGIKIDEGKFKVDFLTKFMPHRNKTVYREKIKKFFDLFINLTKSEIQKQPLQFVPLIEEIFSYTIIEGEQIEWRELFIANLYMERKPIKKDVLNDIFKVNKK